MANQAPPTLEGWRVHVSACRIEACERILREAHARIAATGADRDGVVDALREAVEALNAFDDAEGNFVTTIEAEDLSSAIDALARGTPAEGTNVADAWRTW